MFKIGFSAYTHDEGGAEPEYRPEGKTTHTPVKSVVQVHFPDRSRTLSYYNDAFDLHKGDIVYVEGKLEGLRGQVVDITYNFKIKG